MVNYRGQYIPNLSEFDSKYQLGAPAQTWQQYSIHGCTVESLRYRASSGEGKFIEQIKAPIFLEVVLALEIM